MSSDLLVPVLFMITFVAVLAFGFYQWRKARKAKEEHKHSNVGDLRDPPKSPLPRAPRMPGDRI